MRKYVWSISSIALLGLACAKTNPTSEPTKCNGQNGVRVGAMCKDGYRSSATGKGACSSHGGVDYWLCEDNRQ